MNPIIAEALAQLEQAGASLAIEAVTILVKDLASGKSVTDACNDLAMTMAEKEVSLANKALDAAGL